MKIRENIPNAITAGNLFCGCVAVVFAFRGDLMISSLFVALAAFLDFFDGFFARLLKVSSPIGKDLDSLADMVSFGLVPGITVFHLMYFSIIQTKAGNLPLDFSKQYSTDGVSFFFSSWEIILPYCAFLITVFSALRLAKFNNDVRQSDSFIGLPTPANAIFIMGIPVFLSSTFGFDNFDFAVNPLFYSKQEFNSLMLSKSVGMILSEPQIGSIEKFSLILLSSKWFYLFLTITSSYFLVSEIPMISLKFKKLSWKGNEIRWILIAFSVLSLLLIGFSSFSLIILIYLLISLFWNLSKINQPKPLE